MKIFCFREERSCFLQRTCPPKRGSLATLIKALFYLKVGSVAPFLCRYQSYFSLIAQKISTKFVFMSHLEKIEKI